MPTTMNDLLEEAAQGCVLRHRCGKLGVAVLYDPKGQGKVRPGEPAVKVITDRGQVKWWWLDRSEVIEGDLGGVPLAKERKEKRGGSSVLDAMREYSTR
jgi:hypothetical protein